MSNAAVEVLKTHNSSSLFASYYPRIDLYVLSC